MKHSTQRTARTTNGTTNRTTKKRDKALESIARTILHIETLTERKGDAFDFHEVSVWGLKDALSAAYALGLAAAKKGV